MNNSRRVAYFIVLIIFLMIGIFIGKSMFTPTRADSDDSYKKHIDALRDTINDLKVDIESYEVQLNELRIEKDNIKESIRIISNDAKTRDKIISTNSVDANIRFLSRFLSEKDDN